MISHVWEHISRDTRNPSSEYTARTLISRLWEHINRDMSVRNLFGESSIRYENKTMYFGHKTQWMNHNSGKYELWAEMVWAEMAMGQNRHGPKWSWAEMTSDPAWLFMWWKQKSSRSWSASVFAYAEAGFLMTRLIYRNTVGCFSLQY